MCARGGEFPPPVVDIDIEQKTGLCTYYYIRTTTGTGVMARKKSVPPDSQCGTVERSRFLIQTINMRGAYSLLDAR